MFDTTITVFNRRKKGGGDIWIPHVLHETEYENDRASIMQRFGTESSDSAMLVINCRTTQEGAAIEGIPYLPPKQYASLDDDTAPSYITFNPNAQDFDFIALGDCGYTEAVSDADYKGGFYAYMSRTKDQCHCITQAAGPYNLIPHFRLMLK